MVIVLKLLTKPILLVCLISVKYLSLMLATHVSLSIFSTSVSSPTCRPEEVSTNSTTFKWPETYGGFVARFTCPNNMLFTVTRHCRIGGHWDMFDEEGCGTLAPKLSVLVVQNVIYST